MERRKNFNPWQVTIYSNTRKPIGTVVERKEGMTKQDVQNAGIIKICNKMGWTDISYLKKYGYTKVKSAPYEMVQEMKKERKEK